MSIYNIIQKLFMKYDPYTDQIVRNIMKIANELVKPIEIAKQLEPEYPSDSKTTMATDFIELGLTLAYLDNYISEVEARFIINITNVLKFTNIKSSDIGLWTSMYTERVLDTPDNYSNISLPNTIWLLEKYGKNSGNTDYTEKAKKMFLLFANSMLKADGRISDKMQKQALSKLKEIFYPPPPMDSRCITQVLQDIQKIAIELVEPIESVQLSMSEINDIPKDGKNLLYSDFSNLGQCLAYMDRYISEHEIAFLLDILFIFGGKDPKKCEIDFETSLYAEIIDDSSEYYSELELPETIRLLEIYDKNTGNTDYTEKAKKMFLLFANSMLKADGRISDKMQKQALSKLKEIFYPSTIYSSEIEIQTIQSHKGEVDTQLQFDHNNKHIDDYKESNSDFRKKYEAQYRASDGHYVRSKAELIIDNWFYNHKIFHEYEKYLPINEKVLADFYLPEYDIYIEYWGMENDEKYLARKEKKLLLYKNNQFRLLELTDNDILNIDDKLSFLIANNKVKSNDPPESMLPRTL